MARKRAGENLPGRIRDRVAEAMQISKTKLANLNAIRNGIKVPGIKERWERDEIPEAAALEIARLPVEAQYRLLDWMIDGHHSYSMRDVKKFAVMWGGCRKECPETGGFCPHAQDIYDQDFHGGMWHGAGCCQQCNKNATCPAACGFARRAGHTSRGVCGRYCPASKTGKPGGGHTRDLEPKEGAVLCQTAGAARKDRHGPTGVC